MIDFLLGILFSYGIRDQVSAGVARWHARRRGTANTLTSGVVVSGNRITDNDQHGIWIGGQPE